MLILKFWIIPKLNAYVIQLNTDNDGGLRTMSSSYLGSVSSPFI